MESAKNVILSAEEISEASILQANSMAEKSGIEASEDLLKTYSYLRGVNPDSEKIEGVNPATISDQRLFNEALLILGREEDSEKFKSDYPNIFAKE